eukprot:865892-Pyramimonas_sp.AAC.1
MCARELVESNQYKVNEMDPENPVQALHVHILKVRARHAKGRPLSNVPRSKALRAFDRRSLDEKRGRRTQSDALGLKTLRFLSATEKLALRSRNVRHPRKVARRKDARRSAVGNN